MNKLTKSNLIKAVKVNIKSASLEILLDKIEAFRQHLAGSNYEERRLLLIDQTLYLIELDRRTQNGA